jgi:hypothetical protein
MRRSLSCCSRISRASATALPALAAEEAGHHVLEVDAHLLDSLRGEHLEAGEGLLLDLHLHLPRVEAAGAQLLAQLVARLGAGLAAGGDRGVLGAAGAVAAEAEAGTAVGGRRRQQQLQQPLLGALCRAGAHRLALLLLDHRHRHLDEVAHHRLDVAADVAHFGELARLHLDEGGAGELGEAAGDLRLADAGGADHQDVLGVDLVGHRRVEALAAPAIAQRDRHRLLCRLLADDVTVELGDDLARRQLFEPGERHGSRRRRRAGRSGGGHASSSRVMRSLL